MSNREEFEKQMKGTFGMLVDLRAREGTGFSYMDWGTQVAWVMWQARVPEGDVDVPKEPTDFMRCTVRDNAPDIEDYENMSKWDWEKLCGEIYKSMIEAVEK